MLRWFTLAAFPLLALLAACGGGDQASVPAQATGTPTSPPTGSVSQETPDALGAVDASRFVFGASPGKPVVYWIHTDW